MLFVRHKRAHPAWQTERGPSHRPARPRRGNAARRLLHTQFRLPARYNFRFYHEYPEAARSFYAAHFAHFGVYEMLLDEGPDATDAMTHLEEQIRFNVTNPPRLEPPAEIIAPDWSKIAYATGQAMDVNDMRAALEALTPEQVVSDATR